MADQVTLTIDGSKISVPRGTLVIEAATRLGIDVPRFCYHPKLSAVGMCRMCLGEVGTPRLNPDRTPVLNEDGSPVIVMMPKPQTLCTVQATEGMVIKTDTPDVVKMRQGMLEFFLANHPLDCPVCDKGGECMLQDQSMLYASGYSRVQDLYELRKDLAKDFPLSHLVALDQERCIQCARCTRFQDEIAHDHVLGLLERGSKTVIGTLSDPPFDSKYSGNTIDLCPVGALTSRAFRFRARVWELKNIPTVSMVDSCGTNIYVSQRNETLARVIPCDNEAINECWISDRDRFGLEYVDHTDRLTDPLVRTDGVLRAATWDEALTVVANRLNTLKTDHGVGAIAALGSGKLTCEGALAMSRLFKDVVGTPHVDADCRPAHANPGHPSAAFYHEVETADVILVAGVDPEEVAPILDLRLKKAAFQRKAAIITAHPRKIPLDRLARHILLPQPGSESTLLCGLARLMHQTWTGQPDAPQVSGISEWVESLAPYGPSRVAAECGVEEPLLRSAAELLAGAQRLVVITSAYAEANTFAALCNLAIAKGRLDHVLALHPEANLQGVRRAGLQPQDNGRTGEAILQGAAEGTIKGLYLTATNPLHQAADSALARRAVEKVDFLVVQTLFLNELTEHADVVLPAASFLEQDGTTINCHGLAQRLQAAFTPRVRHDEAGRPLSACAPDWAIFTRLAQILGASWAEKRATDWTAQVQALPAAIPATGLQIPAEAAPASPMPPDHLRLMWGPVLYDGGDSFARCSRLSLAVPEPYVLLHRNLARKLGLHTGDLVELQASRGTVRVRIRAGRLVREDCVWLPWRLGGLQINRLVEPGKPALCTLTKVASAPSEPAVVPDVFSPGVGVPVVI